MVFFFCWTSIVLITHIGAQMQGGNALMLIMLNLLLTIACGLVLFLSSDDIVFITRDGINLPFFLCPGPWLRRRKKWADLLTIQFIADRSRLILYFSGGQKAGLDLRLIAPKQLNELIMALDVWTEGADNFSALLDARTYMLDSNTKNGRAIGAGKDAAGAGESRSDLRYTALWQEELARRFGATNFIPLEPGHKVLDDTYTIERQLAFGGLSAIYLARKNDADQSRFVLKEAVVPQTEDAATVKTSHDLLSREAMMLSALSHEQIARVFDHFVDAGRHYLVLEYIPGQDLRQLVHEEGAQNEAQVLAWAIAMAEMLVYLHEQREPIIHRDFTPDNLLLKTDGSIVVIDFGAANFFLGTATGTMIGKQAYIAPEQLRGKASIQSDLYALGGCLYFLSTAQDPEPLSASHPRLVVHSLSEAFDKLVADCTQMEREDRPPSARAVLARLQQIKVASGDISHVG